MEYKDAIENTDQYAQWRRQDREDVLKKAGIDENLSAGIAKLADIVKACFICSGKLITELVSEGSIDVQLNSQAYDNYVISACNMMLSRIGVQQAQSKIVRL